jgi:hypothetical protein
MRLEFEVLRDAAALTASRDLEEPFMTLSTRRLMRHLKALLMRGAYRPLRHHFGEVMITLAGAAARVDQTGPRHV